MTKEEKESVKGYLFNLIVYTYAKEALQPFQHIISAFVQKYPCRMIFIHVCNNGKNSSAKIERVYDKAVDGRCDQFAIYVSEEGLHKVPFILLPKLIPDLPIYLVWGEDPTSDNHILPDLQKLATRFIFNAKCAEDLQEFSSKMSEKIKELKIDFMDVSWADIGGFRDVISQTFHSSEKVAYLQQCKKLIIKYNPSNQGSFTRSAIQAIYLQGWLAAQLNWKFESAFF